ncbi:MAG TPA: hypothetical protein DCZ94_05310 [Lentisphaeria bacterium]|nr:MAG: hypothetical protein A2X48_12590 [Lentisphaerae bacterium GWF2_49_21]HBC86357.1 hypothetical protein [Lentisphaeria bacterium]
MISSIFDANIGLKLKNELKTIFGNTTLNIKAQDFPDVAYVIYIKGYGRRELEGILDDWLKMTARRKAVHGKDMT